MPQSLEEFLVTGVFAFIVIFVRIGTAVMIMPGIGDSFISSRIRLHFALAFSFVLAPVLMPHMPSPVPATFVLLSLVVMEFIIGVFFGMIARVFMVALDVAGMVISFSASLSNAQLFNPGLAAQGSLVGAFLSITGVVFLFATNMHHLLIMGLVESYELFPVGGAVDMGSMAEFMARAIAQSFLIGVKIGTPFLVLTLMIYVGMGVLSRLMPQIQVFLLALPLQILLALMLMLLVLPAAFWMWAKEFEGAMVYFLSGG